MRNLLKLCAVITALSFVFGFASCKTDDDPTYYTVTIASTITNGTVTTNKTSAVAGDTIKLTATPADGYALDSFSVTDANTNAITVTNGAFTMPASNVTVSATFKETADTVNQKAAAAVIAKITAIGTVAYSDESKAKIDDARSAYDTLAEAQKALVPEETLALLTAAFSFSLSALSDSICLVSSSTFAVSSLACSSKFFSSAIFNYSCVFKVVLSTVFAF